MANETQMNVANDGKNGQKIAQKNDLEQNAFEQEKIKQEIKRQETGRQKWRHESDATEKEKKGAPTKEGTRCACDEEVRGLTDTLKRVQAEFENYQKRVEKQGEENRRYAGAKIMEEILPVLDTLEHGIIHNKGFAAVQEQLMQILRRNGLEKIKAHEGSEFDCETMDAVMHEKNEKVGEGKVAKVLLNGYTLNGKVLRCAKVSVNKLEEKSAEEK